MPSGYKYIVLFLMALGLLSGCVSTRHIARNTPSPQHRPQVYKKLKPEDRNNLALLARKAVGRSKIAVAGKSFRADCSGTVRAIFAAAKIPLGGIIKNSTDNDVKTIYRFVQRYGQIYKENPKPGDLVFFHNTYNRSGSGRMNDALTHIGIIEKVDGEIVHFVHHMGHSIIRSRMNLQKPKLSRHPQTSERINHVLRRAQRGQRSYTAAELFAGFGRL